MLIAARPPNVIIAFNVFRNLTGAGAPPHAWVLAQQPDMAALLSCLSDVPTARWANLVAVDTDINERHFRGR